jgi:hypothetical protein
VRYTDVVDGEFLRILYEERLMTIRGASWITRSTLDDPPGEVIARAAYFHYSRDECLVRFERALVHAILSDRALTIRVAGGDVEAVTAAIEEFRAKVPEVQGEDQEVPVRFWWWGDRGAQEVAQMMPAPSWAKVAGNYGSATNTSLEPLVTWSGAPPGGGRLLLWHGLPGTGKTTAVRTLAWEWRSWSEFQFITDPEQFLQNPSYLMQAISNSRRPAGIPANRWKVLVLEDAGEFLAPDAKQHAGEALSRLLNVCDGVLGQATRSLVLVTTNESLQSMHPALSRPGRCLANIEFLELSQAEIERWCELLGVDAPQRSRASLADLYARAEGRSVAKRAAGFGFTQAA